MSISISLGIILSILASTQETQTSTRGSIRAKIRYEGPLPRPEKLSILTNAEVCGARRAIFREDLVVSGNSGLVNTAGFLLEAPAITTPRKAELNQENCVFTPHVQTVTAGAELTIGNQDPVIHNVHARLGPTTIFNIGMPLRGVEVKRSLPEPGVVTLQCDSGHTWMRAYLVVVPHQHHATSNTDGELILSRVPAGSYTLRTWHERLGVLDTPVKVAPGREAQVMITYRGTAEKLAKDAVPPLELAPREPPTPPPPRTATAEPTKPAPHREDQLARRRARRDADIAGGATLFSRWCATCHGDEGDGRGESAPSLSTRPRDFTRGELAFRSTPSGELAREDDIFRTITTGIPGTDMPAWRKVLDAKDRRALARYVTTFSDRYLYLDPPPPIAIPPETPNDAPSLLRGRAWYVKLQCGQCHGEDGRAGGVSRRMLDDWNMPIEAPDLTRGIYKSGTTPYDLYRTLATGLSGTPMPSFADQIGPIDLWDLVHYVLSLAERSALRDFFGLP